MQPPKIVIKTTGIQGSLQQLALEIGLDTYTVAQLGQDWHNLCEDWIAAEVALMRLGGPITGPALEFMPPQCLVNWSNSRSKKNTTVINFSGLGNKMRN